MTHRHAVVLLCVVGVVLVAPAIVAQETPTPTANATNESDDAGMGTQMTAFLQSSSAAANDSVENGMWRARFEQANASQRAGLVSNRTGTLETRLTRLQEQNESIREQYANGSLPQPAYVARQSQLSARITALQAAINDTDEAASETGVNDSRLETLRRNASELTGPQVASVARGLGGGPPADRPGGPPNGTGPPENSTGPGGPPDGAGPSGNGTTAGNGTAEGNPGTTGPPDNASGNTTSENGADGDSSPGDGSNSGADSGSNSAGGADSGSDSGSNGAGNGGSTGGSSDSGSSAGGSSGSGGSGGSGSGSGGSAGGSSGSSGSAGGGSGGQPGN